MKTEPIVPARVEWTAEGLVFAPDFDDVYFPSGGASEQARHVFLAGNGLPERWRDRERFVVLETGFGLGNNFLATWDAWRNDEHACRQLHFVSIERHPLSPADLARAHGGSALEALASQLIEAWPTQVPNLHRLSFEGGRLQLLLALGDVQAWLPELALQADAFYLDGFAPAKNPRMWEARVFKALGRLAAPHATAATWSAARAVRDGLRSAGFEVRLASGIAGKRDISLARYAPAFTPRRAPARRPAEAGGTRHAVIVGAGLAGCAAAWALAEQGWSSTLLDRRDGPAQESSGNPAGLFHGIVNPQDGSHARFNRAAALEAHRAARIALAEHAVSGSADGLLRLETSGATSEAMQATLARLALPSDYVQAVAREQASRLCGIGLDHPAWFYPGGGWIQPAGFARSFLERASDRSSFRGGIEVQSLRRAAHGWQLLDAAGELITEAGVVILANASAALRLLGSPDWPVHRVRGQVSMLPHPRFAQHGGTSPRIPVAGAGYLLPELEGLVVFGASSQPGDEDPAVRASDHEHNLAQLARLTGLRIADIDPASLQGRTGWRVVSDDRLPLIGAVPDNVLSAASHDQQRALRLDQVRLVPRLRGLFVFTALGSRGITWAAVGGQVLASAITGAPSPLESSLLDAVDPARFIARSMRRQC